jgi:hypothetical protein
LAVVTAARCCDLLKNVARMMGSASTRASAPDASPDKWERTRLSRDVSSELDNDHMDCARRLACNCWPQLIDLGHAAPICIVLEENIGDDLSSETPETQWGVVQVLANLQSECVRLIPQEPNRIQYGTWIRNRLLALSRKVSPEKSSLAVAMIRLQQIRHLAGLLGVRVTEDTSACCHRTDSWSPLERLFVFPLKRETQGYDAMSLIGMGWVWQALITMKLTSYRAAPDGKIPLLCDLPEPLYSREIRNLNDLSRLAFFGIPRGTKKDDAVQALRGLYRSICGVP